jgi:EAL domain-containing protein (putative c-di-GMP-specific phosphodiesterase class I)
VIELTEGENPTSDEQSQRHIEQLKEAGIKIAMDEFGSGASSLEALDRTRVDVVKISRNLVSTLGQSEDSRGELIQTILSLAERLDLEVVAVGVENDRQLELLREFGCQRGQGYYLGKPVSVTAFVEGFDADIEPDVSGVQVQ